MDPKQRIDLERQVLSDLVTLGERFRSTPIVDDDFPIIRDRFDGILEKAKKHLAEVKKVEVYSRYMHSDGCMGMQEVLTHTAH